MTHQTASARSSDSSSSAALLPILAGSVLTLLWGAYSVFFVYEMILLGMP